MNHSNSQQNPDLMFQHAYQLHSHGQLRDAEQLYNAILQRHSGHLGCRTMLGTLYVQTGRDAEGIKLLERSLKADPKQFWGHNTLGVAYINKQQFQKAYLSLHKAIQLNPEYTDAYFNLGKVQRALKHFAEAVKSYSKCISLHPKHADAYTNRGTIYLEDMHDVDNALIDYQQALRLAPESWHAHYNVANAYDHLHQDEDALSHYAHALKLNPQAAEVYMNRGVMYKRLGREAEAISDFHQSITLKPDNASAYFNLGGIYDARKSYSAASHAYQQVIRIKPQHAEAHFNYGVNLLNLRLYEQALDAFASAIRLKPTFADAYFNRGITYTSLARYDLALEAFEKAIKIDPKTDYLLGYTLHAKLQLCDWRDYDALATSIIEGVKHKQKVISPFTFLAVCDQPAEQSLAAQVYVEHQYPTSARANKIPPYPQRNKIRIAYFSSDLRNHALMHLIPEMFEWHDKARFEVYGFAFGPESNDVWRARAVASFDQFFEVNHLSDDEVVALAKQHMIDIAIDLNGYTSHARTGIFALRAAPIQVNYMGYPGTMAVDFMDYIIADRTIIPEAAKDSFAEKIVFAPDCYQINMKHKVIAETPITRTEMGLPEEAIVFCSFNSNYKITPMIFACWMQILEQVPNSVLWIFKSNDIAEQHLKSEAMSRGVDIQRLVFAEFMPIEQHLKRLGLADLFLDTFPYNAHTTASDALRVGTPIITMMGDSFASRVAASALKAVGLPELITENQEDYVALAVELARHPTQLTVLKQKLQSNVLTAPLFDSESFTRQIEFAYQTMYQRNQQGLLAEHIYLHADSA